MNKGKKGAGSKPATAEKPKRSQAARKINLAGDDPWRMLVEHIPDPITRFNQKLQFVYVNKAFLDITNLGVLEVIGKTNAEIGTPPKIAELWSEHLVNVFKTGEPSEMQAYYPFGEEINYMVTRIVPEFDEDGNVITALAIGRDITEQKRAERKEKLQRQLLQGIIDAPAVGMGIFKAVRDEHNEIVDFRIEFVNKKTLQAFGGVDPTGALLSSFGTDGTEQFGYFKEAVETGKTNTYSRKAESGIVEGWFLFSNAALGDDKVVHIWEDITDIKRTEEELLNSRAILESISGSSNTSAEQLKRIAQQLQDFNTELEKEVSERTRELAAANAELNAFTSVAANDYQDLLKNLYVSLEMIRTGDAQQLSNAGRANLRRAQSAIQKMKLLTEDLVSYSKLHQTESAQEVIDIEMILDKARKDFQEKHKYVKIDIDCVIPGMKGYSSLLPLLFEYLFDNAIKRQEEIKEIEIRISCEKSVETTDPDPASTRGSRLYNVITVTDNGLGFTATESEQLFDFLSNLHQRDHKKGSAVKLAICKKIMQLHDGFITVDSKSGEGTSFHIYFPA